MTTREPDRRPCPGCKRTTTDHAEYRYRYPGELEAGEWAIACPTDVAFGFFRCGGCIGRDTRAWQELGRPVGTSKPPSDRLNLGTEP